MEEDSIQQLRKELEEVHREIQDTCPSNSLTSCNCWISFNFGWVKQVASTKCRNFNVEWDSNWVTLESFLKLCICECTWEAILHQLIGSFSHYLHLFIYRLYTFQVQDLFHQQHVESTLSHHLPVLYSSLPENKQPTGVSLPGSFMLEALDTTEKNYQLPALIGGIPIFAWFANLWIEDLCFKQAFVEAFHLDFSVYRCCEQGTLEETNAVAEKTRGLSSVMCWGVKNRLRNIWWQLQNLIFFLRTILSSKDETQVSDRMKWR